MAVMFIDLNKFKDINDRHGHTIGDRLLVMVAKRLLSSLRSTDTVSRWGGDEFVLLFPGVNSLENAAKLAEKVVRGLQAPFRVGELELMVSASAGISLYPDHGPDLDRLLQKADAAMYSDKKNEDGLFSVDAEKE